MVLCVIYGLRIGLALSWEIGTGRILMKLCFFLYDVALINGGSAVRVSLMVGT